MPVQWYALLTGQDASLLFDPDKLQGFKQLWMASPFHAQLGRDQLRVMPDGMFAWREEDSLWICDLLNPLLEEEGMKLICQGAALALLCKEALDAKPVSFARVSGATLPNRHPEGRDGGLLMRLMAEIQMLLNQHRRDSAHTDVDGLWLWGGSDISRKFDDVKKAPVATRNPVLQSLVDGKEAGMILTEADRLAALLKVDASLPETTVLAGDDHAVVLKKSVLASFGTVFRKGFEKGGAEPVSVKDEHSLVVLLRGLHAA